jgi:xanthine dehydrogenase YagS FAD-binding subunit
MSTIATTLTDAQKAQGEIRAGGTDLMDRHRHHVSEGPVVDIARIPHLDDIHVNKDGTCTIGALVTIHEFANHPIIKQHYPGLSHAGNALANPQVRRAASMGGALLQRNRCWYFRHEDIACYKKGGSSCPMRDGNHQYGVCFDLGPCVSPHPSTLGMALLAYDAHIEVHGRGLRTVAELYGDGKYAQGDHLLASGEILTHIHLPKPLPGELAGYFRSIGRERAEWPLVEVLVRGNAADSGGMANVHVVMGGVANVPVRLPKVEAWLNGKSARKGNYEHAGALAAEGANPLAGTQYKVKLIPGTVATALEWAFINLETDGD